VIFGDGAGAAVLRPGLAGEPGALMAVHLGSDGGLADLIMIPGGGASARTSGRPAVPGEEYFAVQGRAVFRTAVQRMAESVGQVLDRTGWDVGSVDWLVGHQANVRILHAVAEQVGLPPERAYLNIERVGNTSAASIPLALAEGAVAGAFRPGARMVLTAFGGGAAWGAVALSWPDLKVEEF
jgi:3-oxoacyl-[acyl-carrier-protein] synthase III